MAMVFCRACGKEIHETAPICPNCGAPQQVAQAVSTSAGQVVPDGVAGWSWGAFLLNWIWAIGNRTWIGLLALVPFVGWIMAIVLGIKGREWAWKSRQWESVDHFNRVQKKWSYWAVMILVIAFVIGLLAALIVPAHFDYQRRAQEVAAANAAKSAGLAPADEAEGQAPVAGKPQAAPATLWSQEFKQQTFDGCAQAATQHGSADGVEACRCLVDKASTSIPELRMADAQTDAEVQSVLRDIVASCRQ